MSLARLHFVLSFALLLGAAAVQLTGFVLVDGASPRVNASVRENPASYRPVYVPLGRSSGSGGSSGGWGSGK